MPLKRIKLEHRLREPEWMDRDDADPTQVRDSLAFIRRINHWLGYARSTICHLENFSRGWRTGQTIRLLDLATGSADIPRAILRWGAARRFDIHIVAIDRHPLITREARASKPDPRLQIVQADVFDLPFDPGSFDYTLTAMFLHHLDEHQVVQVLRTMDRLSSRGLIVGDLLRDPRAYAFISAMTLFANPMLRHDARVSVAQAFTAPEIANLRDRAGLPYARFFRHFGFRFVLAGEKQSNFPQK